VDRNERRRSEELDRLLDRLSAGEAHLPDDAQHELAATASEARRLHDRSVESPDQAFVRRLKSELIPSPALSANGSTHRLRPKKEKRMQASLRARPADWIAPRRALPALGEIVLAASLIIAVIGAAFGAGPLSRLNGALQTEQQPKDTGLVYGMTQGNAARTGETRGPGPSGSPALGWATEDVGSQPVVYDGAVYLISDRDANLGTATVLAIDLRSGSRLWSANVGPLPETGVAVNDRSVFVSTAGPSWAGGDAGYLVALDRTNGREQWRYEYGGSFASVSPAVVDGTVFVRGSDDSVRAVNAEDGKEIWNVVFGTHPATPEAGEPAAWSETSPAVANGTVFVASQDGTLHAISSEDGSERWSFPNVDDYVETPAVSDGTVYLTSASMESGAVTETVTLHAIDAESGAEKWSVSSPKSFGNAPLVANGIVYLLTGSRERAINAYSAEDGSPLWSFDQSVSWPVLASGQIYVISDMNTIYGLNAATGAVEYSATVGPAATQFAIGDGMLVIRIPNQLFAVTSGSDGTPIAGENASVNPNAGVPCNPPRSGAGPATVPEGTPSASITPSFESGTEGPQPQITLADLPSGEPANNAAVGGVLVTLRDMASCWANSRGENLAGFYTDDFFRRSWTQRAETPEVDTAMAAAIMGPDNQPFESFDSATLLADGRVGVTFTYNVANGDVAGWYVVFAEQDGYWLIDERLEILPEERLGSCC
jgi:outer membrane protein assembly factor BamB